MIKSKKSSNMKYKILNKKAIKGIFKLIKNQFDADFDFEEYAFLKTPKDKIHIVNRDIDKIDFQNIRTDTIGMYFAFVKNNKIRLSIEGSQLIGKKAKKNVCELNKEQAEQWMKGQDIKTENDSEEFVLIKYKKDFLGTGKIKNRKILNFVPKGRRLKTVV